MVPFAISARDALARRLRHARQHHRHAGPSPSTFSAATDPPWAVTIA